MMSGFFLKFCSAYYLLRSLHQAFSMEQSKLFVETHCKYSDEEKTTSKALILLIPVFQENNVIEDAIDYFKSIIENLEQVKLYFITTEKEGPKHQNKTYRSIYERLCDSIFVIHSPNITGSKADQINYAINLITRRIDQENTYFGIFDVDSRPDARGFQFILNDGDSEIIYQMFSIYSENFKEKSLFSKANAIYQTRWSLSYELPSILANYEAKKIVRLTYLIGHGLFIRADYLQANNNFPTNTLTEDIAFGYTSLLQGVYCKPVPFFDYCSVPLNMMTYVKQSARWFSGDLVSLSRVLFHSISQGNLLAVLRRSLGVSLWLFGVPMIFYLLFASMTPLKKGGVHVQSHADVVK